MTANIIVMYSISRSTIELKGITTSGVLLVTPGECRSTIELKEYH